MKGLKPRQEEVRTKQEEGATSPPDTGPIGTQAPASGIPLYSLIDQFRGLDNVLAPPDPNPPGEASREIPGAFSGNLGRDSMGHGVSTRASHLNPRYLLKLRRESKALQIPDFVYCLDDGEREEVISRDPGSNSTFVLRTNSSKREKLENVMPSQWASANNRILAELIDKQEITSQDEIMSYLEYSCRVLDYSQIYAWESVLQFDAQFRRAQALTGCSWASEPNHSIIMHLRVKNPPQQKNPKKDKGRTPG